MGFRELLNRAKTMDDTAMVQILELYNPLLYKYAMTMVSWQNLEIIQILGQM